MLETTVTESASFDFEEASEVLNELPPLVQTSVLRRNRTDFPVWGTILEFCLSLASTCWWRWLKAGKIAVSNKSVSQRRISTLNTLLIFTTINTTQPCSLPPESDLAFWLRQPLDRLLLQPQFFQLAKRSSLWTHLSRTLQATSKNLI